MDRHSEATIRHENERIERQIGEMVQIDMLGQHVEVLQAENARLREALGILQEALGVESNEEIAQLIDNAEELIEATPADDWLERHDAEVRERYAGKCDEISKGYRVIQHDEEYHPPSWRFYYHCVACIAEECATAIREEAE